MARPKCITIEVPLHLAKQVSERDKADLSPSVYALCMLVRKACLCEQVKEVEHSTP